MSVAARLRRPRALRALGLAAQGSQARGPGPASGRLYVLSARRCPIEAGYEESVAELAYEVWFGARHEVTAFEDARPALGRLRGCYALATLSNGNADLERIGLADLFAVSLNARAIGAAKPQPRTFASVAEALGCGPGQILYVGDDPRVDVVGAREAGLRTAWMNRPGREWPADLPPADLEVRACAELAVRAAC